MLPEATIPDPPPPPPAPAPAPAPAEEKARLLAFCTLVVEGGVASVLVSLLRVLVGGRGVVVDVVGVIVVFQE